MDTLAKSDLVVAERIDYLQEMVDSVRVEIRKGRRTKAQC
jgi:hypothetical protein